ncbi:TniQ family protein [Metallibacterium scheffleri]|jgi:hypothetical protein|uniref:TniQ domain-containing protein n=1 Tax=Metallibacterium scheffleri TaxID=993689 RepID=A0A4S3KFG8_9GAMM|nr:TniQ family protein [Metallibacterium scheffleri]THD07342.1 hypothetical protein B1806_15010 [Metallibacterium scheffleri]
MKEFLWTALPPQPLRHTATSQVESLAHYVLRMSEILGLPLASLIKQAGMQKAACAIPCCGLLPCTEQTLRAMEHLTGQNDLRCGTLWAVSRALSLHGAGTKSRPRRWCPNCYAEQTREEWSEPLAWLIRLMQTCPTHGCALVDRCRICGDTQPHGDSVVQRRQCRQCAASLGWCTGSAHLVQSALERWIDAQVLAIVNYAANPQSPQLPADAFHKACLHLQRIPERWALVPAVVRSRLRRGTRRLLPPPTLELLLEVAATQHCDVVPLLTAPDATFQSALWSPLSDRQDAGLRRPAMPRLRLRVVLDHLMGEGPAAHLPPVVCILSRLGLELDEARQAEPVRVARYQQRYLRQGPSARLRRLDIAVARTLRSVALTQHLVPAPAHLIRWRQRLTTQLGAVDASRVCVTAVELSSLTVEA